MHASICTALLVALLLPLALLAEEITVTNGQHPVCNKIKYASTDTTFYKTAYDESYKKAASNAYVFALMASNVYQQYESSKPKFEVPGWRQVGEKETSWRGLGAHVYLSDPEVDRVVVAFEGTNEGSWRDWVFGNLNIYWQGQYAEADALFEQVRAKYPTAQMITTGHSLGGGLAVHVALTHPDVDAFAFNSSPRIFMPKSFLGSGSTITLLSENEDVLQPLREKWGSFDDLVINGPYHQFDFLNLATNNDDKLTEHGMYIIARGLMLVAASYGNSTAIQLVKTLGGSAENCPR